MRRAQDRAQSARSRKNGARSATFKNSGARSATIESRALSALKLASEARDENVPAKRADFFIYNCHLMYFTFFNPSKVTLLRLLYLKSMLQFSHGSILYYYLCCNRTEIFFKEF